MRKEWLARGLVLMLVAAAVSVPLLVRQLRPQPLLLHARMAETGGWTLEGTTGGSPGYLTAVVGEPLHLRLTSDDVLHSFAVGQDTGMPVGQPAVDILPGEISEVTLTFDHPGKYTYYCTRWCSVNHWRMRGVIEVSAPDSAGDSSPAPAALEPPLYQRLSLDLDAERPVPSPLPALPPSAARGAALSANLPVGVLSRDYYLAHSPAELWAALRAESSLARFNDQDLWDLVAQTWQAQTTSQDLAAAGERYTENCAACHGETAAGDGVFADTLAEGVHAEGAFTGAPPDSAEHGDIPAGKMTSRPADFNAPARILSASPALLQGKILRGGMGTGMPYWGPIFTEKQIWDLVAYLYTFQFEQEP